MKADVSVKNLIGRGAGEMMQMQFTGPGEGFVMLQPFEEQRHAK